MRLLILSFWRIVLLSALFIIGISLLGSLGLFVFALKRAWNALCAFSFFDGKFHFLGMVVVLIAAWFLLMAVWANFMRMLAAYREERGVGTRVIAPLWYVFIRTTLSLFAVFPWFLGLNHNLSTRGIILFLTIGLITTIKSFKEGLPHE